MKITKLSLIAALAISTAFAGGDIEKPEIIVVPTPEVATTVDGLAKLYYISNTVKSYGETGSVGSVTLNVTHKLFDGVKANFSAVGYVNSDAENRVEAVGTTIAGNPTDSTAGAFLNIANLTMTYGGTTIIAGRQLINSPMISGYDWQVAPGAFEAYTLVNSSISNLTLVGTYLTKWRANKAGDVWTDLTAMNVNGSTNNWAGGAIYNAGDYGNLSAWYYNVDAFDYTQYYVDYGFKMYGMGIKAQYIGTTYGSSSSKDIANTDASSSYGVEVSAEAYGIKLAAAYNGLVDGNTDHIGFSGLYTTSWNTQAGVLLTGANGNGTDATAYKVTASGEVFGLATLVSYAGYSTSGTGTNRDGSELDVILDYNYNKTIGAQVVYSSTDSTLNAASVGANDAVEVALTYKF